MGGWRGVEVRQGQSVSPRLDLVLTLRLQQHLKEAYLPEQERSLVQGGGGGLGGPSGGRKHPSGPGRCGGLFPLTLRCFSEGKSAATLMKFDHKFPQGASNEQLFLEAVLSADSPPPPPLFPPPTHPPTAGEMRLRLCSVLPQLSWIFMREEYERGEKNRRGR